MTLLAPTREQREAFAEAITARMLLEMPAADSPYRRRKAKRMQRHIMKAREGALTGEVWFVKIFACPPLTENDVDNIAKLICDT